MPKKPMNGYENKQFVSEGVLLFAHGTPDVLREMGSLIVAQEAIYYHRQATAFDMGPMIRNLRVLAEGIVQAELGRAQFKLRSLTPDHQRATEKLIRGTMNKFLHPVIRSLKQTAEQGDVERMQAICAIFDPELPNASSG